MKKFLIAIGCFAIALLLCIVQMEIVQALTTAPQRIVYSGHLLDSSANPITTPHTVRFSFWSSRDHVAGDTTAAGAINTAAANYAGWNEVHTVTPNAQGYFTVELGTVTPLPGWDTFDISVLLNMFLQVEVKAAANPDTAYELMDVNVSDATNDRSPIDSVPFALNADFIDQREIGTGSGDIAILEEGDVFPTAVIPGGTNSGKFVLDFDTTETNEISLQFGNGIGRQLTYNIPGDYFNFGTDVTIQGDLTVTGLINNIDISSISDSHLKVSSGAGLTAAVSSGSYRISGNITNYNGTTGVSLTDNTTNYMFFTSTGLNVNTIGFPTNRSFIPLAAVVTSGGSVSSVTDRRVLQSDDREQTVEYVLHPLFEGASYQGDSTDNVGRMFVDYDAANLVNFYQWTSTLGTLQDYDISVRIRVPSDFTAWEDNSISLDYRSSTANPLDNQLDIEVYDTAGALVTLSGSTTNLVSTTWANTQVEFLGTPTWTPGQDMLVKLKVHARSDNQMHVGDLQLNLRELKQI